MTHTHMPQNSLVRLAVSLTAPVVLLALTGCTVPAPRTDAKMGESFQSAKDAQRIEPTAAQRQKPAPAVTSSEVQRAVTVQTSSFPAGGVPGQAGAAAGATGTGATFR